MIKDLYPAIMARYPKLTEEKRGKVLDILRDVHKSNQGSGGLPMVGAIALGAIVGAVSAVPFGLIAGGGLMALVIGSGLNYGHGLEFAKNHGAIAHLLDDRLLRRYQDIIGHKALLGEIQQAYADGIDVTGDGRNFARQSGSPLTRTRTFDIPKDAPNDSQGSEDGSAQDDGKKAAAAAGNTGTEKVTKDVVEAFISDLRCTVLCAPPRTGKGVVAAGMMMGFKLTFPAGKLFSSTIKQFGDENWYFTESDAHINPNVKDPIGLAKEIYALYTAWEESVSSVDAPSLFVFDELRDTLLALKGVKCEDVSPDIESMEPKFDEWLRNKLISAATLNQCHRRYLLLISPTSTAQGMTFKDANSLQSYSSFTLVTPTELAFSEGNNGTFAAPAIRPDSPLFTGWYGLAWHSKTKQWFGVPSVPKDAIALRESQPVNLNYYKVQAFEDVFPAQMFDRLVKDAATLDRKIEGLGKATVTKAPAKVEQTEEDLENLVYTKLVDKIIALNGEKTTMSQLRRSVSKKQQAAYTPLTEQLILEDERFDFVCRDMPDGNKSISIWLRTDSTTNDSED
jgi:hypothetical protein